MNKNYTLFSAKAIACFFIICIHIQFQGNLGSIILDFARFAVPLFFMISGFFTYYTDKEKMDKTLNKRLKSIGILTLISFIRIFYFKYNNNKEKLDDRYLAFRNEGTKQDI